MVLVPRWPVRLVPCVLALALLAPGLRARGSGPAPDDKLSKWSWETTPAHLVIAQALRESRLKDAAPDKILVRRMVNAGSGTIDALIDILVRARVPETTEQDAPQILSEPQRALLLQSLAQGSRAEIRAAMLARLEANRDDPGTRLAAIHVLGAVGEAVDLARIVDLPPRMPGADQILTRDARIALRDACATILTNDRSAYASLGGLMRRVDDQVAKALLDAAAARKDPRALEILYGATSVHRGLGPLIAALAVKCEPSADPDVNRDFCAWAAAQLGKAKPSYASSLLQALGSLDDGTNVPAMIERLESPDDGVRSAAHWALQRVSGLGFPAEPAAWVLWNRDESEWHARWRPKLRENIVTGDLEHVVSALHAYMTRRTRRASLAGDVEPALYHRSPEVRSLACGVLGHLGSNASVPALLGIVEDPDPQVAEAGWKALEQISGLTLPRDPVRANKLLQSL